MTNYGQFHDGSFEGLWIDGKIAHLFLATEDLQRFVIVAEGVSALAANGFKAGNILFEVLTRSAAEVTLRDIHSLYELQAGSSGEIQGANLLKNIHLEKQEILEVNPSYGASCIVLADSYDLLRRGEWVERYVVNVAR